MLLFCLIVPSFLGLKLTDALLRNKNIKDAFINYGVISLFTNIISIAISMITFKFIDTSILLTNIASYDKFAFLYLVLASVVSLTIGFICSFILKNISISEMHPFE